jgi:uncharacterized protein (TIGR02265 family)
LNAGEGWSDPPWEAPLDSDAEIRAIPREASMTGVFLGAIVGEAVSRGIVLPTARARYTPFQRYPLREHCQLLVELCRAGFGTLPMRAGLRKLGRGAPHALVASNVGRVVFASAEGPVEIIRAMARSYALHMNPCEVEIEPYGDAAAIVRMSQIYNFLDCHNVGVFEGVMRYARVEGVVRVRSYGRTSADLLCDWSSAPRPG